MRDEPEHTQNVKLSDEDISKLANAIAAAIMKAAKKLYWEAFIAFGVIGLLYAIYDFFKA